MVELTLAQESFSLPAICACCLAPTKDKRRIYRRQLEKTWGRTGVKERHVKIPFCDGCSRHVDWKKGGRTLGVVLSFLVYGFLFWMAAILITVVLAIATNAGDDGRGGVYQILGTVAALVLAGIAAGRRYARRPSGPMGPGHAAEGESVELIRYDSDRVGLRIHNDAWANHVRSGGRTPAPAAIG